MIGNEDGNGGDEENEVRKDNGKGSEMMERDIGIQEGGRIWICLKVVYQNVIKNCEERKEEVREAGAGKWKRIGRLENGGGTKQVRAQLKN